MSATKHFTLAVEIPNGYQLFHIECSDETRALMMAQGVMGNWLEQNRKGFCNAVFGESAPKP